MRYIHNGILVQLYMYVKCVPTIYINNCITFVFPTGIPNIHSPFQNSFIHKSSKEAKTWAIFKYTDIFAYVMYMFIIYVYAAFVASGFAATGASGLRPMMVFTF